MFESIKAIQAQQVYKVQPVNLFETSTSRNPLSQLPSQTLGATPFSGQSYNPFYPSVENSPTLARSLDLLG